MVKAATKSSMDSDMFKAPDNPFSNSNNDRRISEINTFIRVHSCIATMTNGPFSNTSNNGSALSSTTTMLKFSGNRDNKFVKVA
jgi:hypothetical protein